MDFQSMSADDRRQWSIDHVRLATTPLILAALDMTCSRFSLVFFGIMKGEFIGNDMIVIFDAFTFVPYGAVALANVQAGPTRYTGGSISGSISYLC
jgi:hypothetical protein